MIKRYANRKLYDTATSRYVTLEEVARMLDEGERVVITDNDTGEDITAVTLAQILLDSKKKKKQVPLEIIKVLLGEKSGGALEEIIQTLPNKVQNLRAEAESRIETMKKKSDSDIKQLSQWWKEFLNESQGQMNEFEKKMEARVDELISNLASSPALRQQLSALEKKLEEAERRLDELSKKAASQKSDKNSEE